MFQVNDKVLYPGHGVAIIEETIEKSVAGKVLKFFKLKFLYKDMTILIPVNGNMHNIRHLNNPTEVDTAIKILFTVPKKVLDASDFTPSSWNKRNKDYQLKIQGGELNDIVCIYRDLMYISKYKELSFGEKNLLQSIEELLIQEIGVVRNKDRSEVIRELRAPFQHITFTGSLGQNTPTTTAV
ncbi:hypothetical protein KAW80_02305 [Candidatus Babeliales bacterium]|nr:hypothetical protein [Candidatus Babeliales bacterium]